LLRRLARNPGSLLCHIGEMFYCAVPRFRNTRTRLISETSMAVLVQIHRRRRAVPQAHV
jgi:hypothetical protein